MRSLNLAMRFAIAAAGRLADPRRCVGLPRLHGWRPENRRHLPRHDAGHERAADPAYLWPRLLALARAIRSRVA